MHGSFSSSLEDMPEFKFLRRLKRCKFIRRDLVISKQPSFWSNNFCPQIIVQMVQFILKKKTPSCEAIVTFEKLRGQVTSCLGWFHAGFASGQIATPIQAAGGTFCRKRRAGTPKMEVGKVICLFNQAGWWFQKLFIFTPIWGRFSF